MSDKLTLEESLSALMDNEVDDLELRRILKALPEHDHLHKTWSRYHLISATMKQESHSRASVNILSGIQLQLESEPAPSLETPIKHAGVSVFRRIGQGAIAASVAIVVLYAANLTTTIDTSSSVNFAENAGQVDQGQEPLIFNGNYTVSEFSRFASFEGSPEDRIRQAVYQEFDELPDNSENQLEFTSPQQKEK